MITDQSKDPERVGKLTFHPKHEHNQDEELHSLLI